MVCNAMHSLKRLVTSAFILSGLVACSPALPPNSSGVLYCSEGNPESFNPQMVTSATTLDMTSLQLYDTLVEYDAEKGSLRPELATAWQVSNDGRTYEFTLRQGVAFHHTDFFTPSRPLNAEDVLFSFQRWLDPNHPYHQVSGGRYPFFRATRLDQLIASISAPSSHVVRLELHQPDSSL